MQELGNKLKAAREEKGLTLRDIERATKIGIRMLEHIEAGEFHKLPSGVFARNFIRQYCDFIDLDAGPVLAEAFDTDAELEVDGSGTAHTDRQSVPGWLIILIILALLIVLGLWVWPGWLVNSGSENLENRSHAQMAEDAMGSVPLNKPDAKKKQTAALSESGEPAVSNGTAEESDFSKRTGEEPTDDKRRAEPTELDRPERSELDRSISKEANEGQNDADRLLSKGPIAVLQFRVNDRCWVHLRCPQRDMDFMLEAGETYTINCGFPVVLTLGNAPVVSLTVNGKPLASHSSLRAFIPRMSKQR